VKYIVRFKPAALVEFNESTEWYESKNSGVGTRFVLAIDHAIEIISLHPARAAVVYKNVRVRSVEKFPYQIYYRLTGENLIEVLSVFHVRQSPTVWRSRI